MAGSGWTGEMGGRGGDPGDGGGYRALTPHGTNMENWQQVQPPHGWTTGIHEWDTRNAAAAGGSEPGRDSDGLTIPMQNWVPSTAYRIPKKGELLVAGREAGEQPTHEGEWTKVKRK